MLQKFKHYITSPIAFVISTFIVVVSLNTSYFLVHLYYSLYDMIEPDIPTISVKELFNDKSIRQRQVVRLEGFAVPKTLYGHYEVSVEPSEIGMLVDNADDYAAWVKSLDVTTQLEHITLIDKTLKYNARHRHDRHAFPPPNSELMHYTKYQALRRHFDDTYNAMYQLTPYLNLLIDDVLADLQNKILTKAYKPDANMTQKQRVKIIDFDFKFPRVSGFKSPLVNLEELERFPQKESFTGIIIKGDGFAKLLNKVYPWDKRIYLILSSLGWLASVLVMLYSGIKIMYKIKSFYDKRQSLKAQ